jgi:nucleotide sugar dehydrogenase
MERVAVVGIGRIGLCLALNLDRAGYDVLGVDTDPERVQRVNRRTLRTAEAGVEEALRQARALRACHAMALLRDFRPDMVLVAVATPEADRGGYDHSQVDRVLEDLFALGPAARRTELALVCTTLPGYGDSRAGEAEARGYFLSYNPGFVAQGSIISDQCRPDQVLIGEADAAAGDALERLHRRMCLNDPAIHRMSRLGAEIAKLATNCFLTMKIAFANAVGDLAVRVGADPERVLGAMASDHRIGPGCLRYGFSYGGPCLPRDNRALNFFARQHDCELLQAAATDQMNHRHVAFQVAQFLRTHREHEAIHFHSITYKPGTDLLDESSPLAVAVQLARAGRRVVIHDTRVVVARVRAEFGPLFDYQVSPGKPRSRPGEVFGRAVRRGRAGAR